MPTAARLIGALYFGLLAWAVSQILIPMIPGEVATPEKLIWFAERNALYGVTWGWILNSQRAHETAIHSISSGITVVTTVVLWALTSTAVSEMLKLSLKKRYKGVGDAFEGVIELVLKFLNILNSPVIIGFLAIGAIIGGALCGWVARRWK